MAKYFSRDRAGVLKIEPTSLIWARERTTGRDTIVCPYHVLAQAGDGEQVDRGHQIHPVIDGEEVVE